MIGATETALNMLAARRANGVSVGQPSNSAHQIRLQQNFLKVRFVLKVFPFTLTPMVSGWSIVVVVHQLHSDCIVAVIVD